MADLKLCLRTAAGWITIFLCVQAHSQEDTSLRSVRQSISAGDFSRAETLLRAALERSPNSPDVHYLLGFVLFHENRSKESLAEYTLGARLRTPGSEELIGVASVYILMKDYSDADHWLTRATQFSPQSTTGWYLLGRTQYNENRIADAERSFLVCLRIDPHHVKAEYNLGLVYEKSNRSDQAIDAYHKAIEWQQNDVSKDPQPYLDLGMLLHRQGHVQEALPYLLAAEAAGPRNPMAHAEVGLCYEQLNRLDEATAELKQALVLSPNVEALHFFLGRVYRRGGHADEAASEFAAAAKLSGSDSNDGIPNEEVRP